MKTRFLPLVFALVSTTALAQPAPPPAPAPSAPEPALAEAKLHFEQGVALYNDGNYNAALAEFLKSYELRKTTGVLYNIGLTQKSLFRYSEAIESLEKYLAESTTMAPERKAEVTQQIAEMRALLADVTIEAEPAGANVLVDGRPMGTAPLAKPLGIASGNHTLEVNAEGYKTQKRDIMVAAGAPMTLKFKLEVIPRTGRVRIRANLPSASIAVDGKMLSAGAAEIDLGPGGHTLEVAAPNYELHREELVVAAGQTRDVNVALQPVIPPKKFYQKWYFWTPVAAVVAGAAIGLGVGFGTRQTPLEGTLSPGVGGVQ